MIEILKPSFLARSGELNDFSIDSRDFRLPLEIIKYQLVVRNLIDIVQVMEVKDGGGVRHDEKNLSGEL